MLKHTPFTHFSLRQALLAACAGLIFLSGCKSTEFGPLTANINTTPALSQAAQPHAIPAQLRLVDLRPQHHVLRLHHNTEPAQFATFQQPLTMIIQQQLAPYLADPTNNAVNLQLTIEEGLCIAQQSFSRHNMQCRFAVQVVASQAGDTWTKAYTASRSREGQFKLKPNHVESDMQAVMHTALSHFVDDHEFHSWLTRP